MFPCLLSHEIKLHRNIQSSSWQNHSDVEMRMRNTTWLKFLLRDKICPQTVSERPSNFAQISYKSLLSVLRGIFIKMWRETTRIFKRPSRREIPEPTDHVAKQRSTGNCNISMLKEINPDRAEVWGRLKPSHYRFGIGDDFLVIEQPSNTSITQMGIGEQDRFMPVTSWKKALLAWIPARTKRPLKHTCTSRTV